MARASARRREEWTQGLDQGCPFSPAIYCLAVRDALAATQWDMRQVDPDTTVVAYLDDTYLVGSPSAVIVGMMAFGREMLETQVWAPTTPCRDLPSATSQ